MDQPIPEHFFPVIFFASCEKRKPTKQQQQKKQKQKQKPNNQETMIICILNVLISALFGLELKIYLLEVTCVNVVGWWPGSCVSQKEVSDLSSSCGLVSLVHSTCSFCVQAVGAAGWYFVFNTQKRIWRETMGIISHFCFLSVQFNLTAGLYS